MTVIDFIKRGLGSSFKGTVDIGMVFLICIWDIVEEWQRGRVSCKCRNFRTTCVSWMMFTLLFVLIIRVTVASPQTWADTEACSGVLPPGLQAQAPSPESRHVFAVLPAQPLASLIARRSLPPAGRQTREGGNSASRI